MLVHELDRIVFSDLSLFCLLMNSARDVWYVDFGCQNDSDDKVFKAKENPELILLATIILLNQFSERRRKSVEHEGVEDDQSNYHAFKELSEPASSGPVVDYGPQEAK